MWAKWAALPAPVVIAALLAGAYFALGTGWASERQEGAMRGLTTKLSPHLLSSSISSNGREDAEAALSLLARVHGFLPKAGPTKLELWLGNRNAMQDQAKEWIEDAGEHPDSEQAAVSRDGLRLTNMPPSWPCMIHVNHRYKIVYIRTLKAASSTLMRYFMECSELGEEGRAQLEAAAAAGQPLGHGAACLEPLYTSRPPPHEMRRIWEEYFVFSVVRNPYQRMLSSYKYLLPQMLWDPGCPKVSWDDHCRDPLAMGRVCAARPECCTMSKVFAWRHVGDQVRCLEAEGGGWSVDYLATVEGFDEDVQEIVAEIDRRRPAGLPPVGEVTRELKMRNVSDKPGGDACGEEEEEEEWEEGEGEEGGQQQQREEQGENERAQYPRQVRVNGTLHSQATLEESFCNPADYFRGPHEHCLLRTRHFYSMDFTLLFPSSSSRT